MEYTMHGSTILILFFSPIDAPLAVFFFFFFFKNTVDAEKEASYDVSRVCCEPNM